MKKICLTALLLAFPAAQLWAGENIDAQAPPPAESALDGGRPVLVAANKESVTTFRYKRPSAADREDKATAEAEPKKLQRSHSRPKVVVYGDREPASGPKSSGAAEERPRTIKKGLNTPEVTTFQYQSPEAAESVEAPKPAPAPTKAKRVRSDKKSAPAAETGEAQRPDPAPAPQNFRRDRAAERSARTTEAQKHQSAPVLKSAVRERAAKPAAAKSGPTPPEADRPQEETRPRKPSKPEVKYTVLNERAETLEMAKPHTAVSGSRTAGVRAANIPPPAAPTLESGGFNVAGVYVNCPKNKEENCGAASEEFRAFFPHDQTAPYLMIRKDGRGYVAPNNKRTVDFTWRFIGGDAVLIDLEGSQSRTVEYRAVGRHLRNMVTGELFYMSLTDDEWNVPPEETYSKLKARREKAKK